MNNSERSKKLLRRLCGSTATAFFIILLLSTSAAAADSGWRPIYDKVMLWINFFIFIFLAVKFGKKPFLTFLQGQKDEVADQIHGLQKQKNAMEAQINKTNTMIQDSSVRFEQIKSRIIEDGERSRQKIIDDAKSQSKNIIEIEKLKAVNQIAQAKDNFMSDLVDEASALAMKKLPSEINDSDHHKLLDLFLSNISKIPKQSA